MCQGRIVRLFQPAHQLFSEAKNEIIGLLYKLFEVHGTEEGLSTSTVFETTSWKDPQLSLVFFIFLFMVQKGDILPRS